jgi:hypothetical protein
LRAVPDVDGKGELVILLLLHRGMNNDRFGAGAVAGSLDYLKDGIQG